MEKIYYFTKADFSIQRYTKKRKNRAKTKFAKQQ